MLKESKAHSSQKTRVPSSGHWQVTKAWVKSHRGSNLIFKSTNGIIKKHFSSFKENGLNRIKDSFPVFKGVKDYYEEQKFGILTE